MHPGSLSKAIDAIYASLDGPQMWPKALDACREMLGAAGGTFVSTESDGVTQSIFCANPGAPFEHAVNSRSGVPPKIPLFNKNKNDITRGTFPAAEVHRYSKYYEKIEKLDLKYYLCADLQDERFGNSNVTFYWKSDHGPVGEDEFLTLKQLRLHLNRALRNLNLLEELQTDLSASWSIADWSPHGMIMLDTGLRIVHINDEARDIIENANGLSVIGRRLRATNRMDDAHLQSVLAESVAGDDAGIERPWPSPIVIKHANDKHPVILRAVLLSADGDRARRNSQRVAVFLRDPGRDRFADVEGAAKVFSLTEAETRLIAALASGVRVAEYAASEGISRETARWHLKNIYMKMGCDSQLDLINLIYRSELPHKNSRVPPI